MAEIKVTAENYEAEVVKSDIPVLVDFWAEWCGPCKMLGPVLSEIAEENEGKIKVCKVNVDDEAELARSFGIRSIPTVLAYRNGEIVEKSIGFTGKAELLALFD